MAILVDTSVLGRLANKADSSHAIAKAAVAKLHRQGETLMLAPQNLVEFRNFATRPTSVNGLGLSPAEAEALATAFEAAFPILGETPDIFPAWKVLVGSLGIIGKRVHDARLVAVCHVNSVSEVLTFNVAHFAPMARFGPGVRVIDPASV